MRRYASWGTDGSYRYKWRAKLQDIIFAIKMKFKKRSTDEEPE